jgi:hypothetical protein
MNMTTSSFLLMEKEINEIGTSIWNILVLAKWIIEDWFAQIPFISPLLLSVIGIICLPPLIIFLFYTVRGRIEWFKWEHQLLKDVPLLSKNPLRNRKLRRLLWKKVDNKLNLVIASGMFAPFNGESIDEQISALNALSRGLAYRSIRYFNEVPEDAPDDFLQNQYSPEELGSYIQLNSVSNILQNAPDNKVINLMWLMITRAEINISNLIKGLESKLNTRETKNS